MPLSSKIFFYITLFILLIHYSYLEPSKPCEDTPKLLALPGLGWDALKDRDTKQILNFTYDHCKTTADGKYRIPGTTLGIIRNNEIAITSKIMEHWDNYTAADSAGLRVSTDIWPSKYLPLYYSYSDDYQEMKHLQVKHDAFTVRSEIRLTFYTIITPYESVLTEPFKQRLIEVISAVNRNLTEKAKYLLEMIVGDYGTHYTSSIDVGTAMIREDYLRHNLLTVNNEIEISSIAKFSLCEDMGCPINDKETYFTSVLKTYDEHRVTRNFMQFGEVNWKKGISSVNMVAINKYGDLLTNLVTVKNFPNVSESVLDVVEQMLADVIHDYYTRNIHLGCTNKKSSNFDYIANIDDGSCKAVASNYVFGGVFQNCIQQEQYFTSGECKIFGKFNNNPMIGLLKCVNGYEAVPLFTYYSSYYYTNRHGYSCGSYTLQFRDYFKLTTYVCMSNSTLVDNRFQFGGVYSSDVVNFHTGNASCPPLYKDITIFEGSLSICVNSTNDPSTNLYELPFGGFTSYMQEYLCPVGYVRYLAVNYNGINVYYCIRELNHTNIGLVPLIERPPYGNDLKSFEYDDDEDFDDYGIAIIKHKESSTGNGIESTLFVVLAGFLVVWSKLIVTQRQFM